MAKEQIDGMRQMDATGSGVLGFLGACACCCKYTPGAGGLREEVLLFVVTADSAPLGCCAFRFSHILPEDFEFCS